MFSGVISSSVVSIAMKPEARLDSAVFQLTPTRTRYELVIISGKKRETVTSGILSPFLDHLKSAQDQIDRGGYSITLQPVPDSDTTWFTKGTVERFVRFVNTPEILERVNTIESEILQIEEAIAIQGNESLGLTTVEVYQKRSIENMEGGKQIADTDAEKAIVLYKPGSDPPQTNGSIGEPENSKVQLLRVLETRRTVLQKEQGMAFARAAAAGFDMDHVTHLLSFSECFGATRLLAACVKFMELWKGKHETGQWFEIEAAEALSMRSDISPLNVSGVVISGSNGDRSIEGNGKYSNDDKRAPGNPQVSLGPHDHPQGQFHHPMFPQWPIHSPPGAAAFQSHPIQGMPYFPNYTGGSPFFHSPYNQMEDPRFNAQRRMKKKKHSIDSEGSSDDSDGGEIGVSSTRSPDGSDTEVLEGKASHRKTSRSGKKRSGVVVIRNINYITSKKHGGSGSEQESDSNSEMEEETGSSHRHGKGSLKSKMGKTSSIETLNFSKEEGIQGQDTDSENWQVFQRFLLRNEESRSTSDQAMFTNENTNLAKRKQTNNGVDPILHSDRDPGDVLEDRIVEFDTVDGRIVRRSRQIAPDDELVSSSRRRMPRENQANLKFLEVEGGRTSYIQGTEDDSVLYGRVRPPNSRNSLDLLAENGGSYSMGPDKSSQPKISDESFMIPLRSHSHEPSGTSRGAIYADTVFQSNIRETEDSADKIQNLAFNEPNDLTLMLERDTGGDPTCYDSAIYYDMEMHASKIVISNKTQEDKSSAKKGVKPDNEKKIRASQSCQERKQVEALRRGRPSKLNLLTEAQARAGKLRALKADLQKVKKEKEAEEIKRLEALKRERQRRIAARGTSSSVQPGTTPLQNRSRVPAKFSQNLHRGSKFSDSEPASSSPLQKVSIRRASTGSSVPHKVMATSKLSSDRQSQNGLNRSMSSLLELKKESESAVTDRKTISVTRRLSDPKGGAAHHSSLKSASTVRVSKPSPHSKGNNNVHALLPKFQKIDRLGKKNVSEEPQIKKISAIINLDKSKAATLPELKLRTPTAHTDVVQAKTNTKDTGKKEKKDQLPLTPENFKGKNTMEKSSQSTVGDESLVIEKTVVILEQERFPSPLMASQEISKTIGSSRKETKIETECKAGRDSPPVMVNVCINDTVKSMPPEQPTSYEVVKDDSQKLSTFIHAEKPYQAPHARLSSMESISDLDHFGALPITTSEMVKKDPDATQTSASNFTAATSVEWPSEVLEKARGKERKGFKRLLKFGKRSQNSSNEERSMDPGGSSADGHAIALISSSEVPSLKHLISKEGSHIGSAPPKASRPFSILSPFRIKSSERKITV